MIDDPIERAWRAAPALNRCQIQRIQEAIRVGAKKPKVRCDPNGYWSVVVRYPNGLVYHVGSELTRPKVDSLLRQCLLAHEVLKRQMKGGDAGL